MRKKLRVEIPKKLAAEVIYEHDRTCCVCNERGMPVQIHHIDENPSNNEKSNLAVLCLKDHNDTQLRGGFGRQLTAPIVHRFRDEWVARVSDRRLQANTIERTAYADVENSEQPSRWRIESFGTDRIHEVIENLPAAYRGAKALVESGFGGSNFEMKSAGYELIDILTSLWIRLVNASEITDFDGTLPREFMENFILNRFRWHRVLAEPEGAGTGGTIVGLLAIAGVMEDLESAIAQTVASCFPYEDHEGLESWKRLWREASAPARFEF